MLKITFEINSSDDHYVYYEIKLKEPLSMRKNGSEVPIISKAKCYTYNCYGHNATTQYPNYHPKKDDSAFSYESLRNAYDKIYEYLVTQLPVPFTKAVDYIDTIQYFDGNSWQPIKNIIVW